MARRTRNVDNPFSPIEPFGEGRPSGAAYPPPANRLPAGAPPASSPPGSPHLRAPHDPAPTPPPISSPIPPAPQISPVPVAPEARFAQDPPAQSAADPGDIPPSSAKHNRSADRRRRFTPILVLLMNIAIIAFTALGLPWLIGRATGSSTDDAVTTKSLAADVIRLERINGALQKSLADTKNAANASDAARLEQTRTVVAGVAADLATCSEAMKAAADQMAELARTNPAAAPASADTMLERCGTVAEQAATAAKALDG